jgi:hypothetical protein
MENAGLLDAVPAAVGDLDNVTCKSTIVFPITSALDQRESCSKRSFTAIYAPSRSRLMLIASGEAANAARSRSSFSRSSSSACLRSVMS